MLASADALLAQAVYEQDRLAEADDLTFQSEKAAAADDLFTQLVLRFVRARVRARQGQNEEAERVANEAIKLSLRTDWIDMQADAELALADVLQISGLGEARYSHLKRALSLYERKGCTAMAGRVRLKMAKSIAI